MNGIAKSEELLSVLQHGATVVVFVDRQVLYPHSSTISVVKQVNWNLVDLEEIWKSLLWTVELLLLTKHHFVDTLDVLVKKGWCWFFISLPPTENLIGKVFFQLNKREGILQMENKFVVTVSISFTDPTWCLNSRSCNHCARIDVGCSSWGNIYLNHSPRYIISRPWWNIMHAVQT